MLAGWVHGTSSVVVARGSSYVFGVVVGKLWKFTSIDRSIAAVIIGSSGSSCSIAAGGAGGNSGLRACLREPERTNRHRRRKIGNSRNRRHRRRRVALLGNSGTHTGTERPTGGSRTLGTSHINAVVLFVFGGAGWLAGFGLLRELKGEATTRERDGGRRTELVSYSLSQSS